MSLKILSEKRGVLIGTAVAIKPLRENQKYRDIVVYEDGEGPQVRYPGYAMNHISPEVRDHVSRKA